jgi:hypothetical protein
MRQKGPGSGKTRCKSGATRIGIHGHKVWMLFGKCSSHAIVFGFEQAAGRVHQTPTGLDQLGSGRKDGALTNGEFGDIAKALPPLEIRISPQRPGTAARGIDQHTISAFRESGQLWVRLRFNAHGLHIGRARPQ